MTKYRVIHQERLPSQHRLDRSHKANEALAIEAVSLHAAVVKAQAQLPAGSRIVSIEEILEWPTITITDTLISKTLQGKAPGQQEPFYEPLDPDDWAGATQALYMQDDFVESVLLVADALRNSGLVPELTITATHSPGYQAVEDVMIEIHDRARGLYVATYAQVEHLIEDRDLVGWPAVVSIARSIIDTVSAKGMM